MNREDENCFDSDRDSPNDHTHIITFCCNKRNNQKWEWKDLLHSKDMPQEQP